MRFGTILTRNEQVSYAVSFIDLYAAEATRVCPGADFKPRVFGMMLTPNRAMMTRNEQVSYAVSFIDLYAAEATRVRGTITPPTAPNRRLFVRSLILPLAGVGCRA